MFVTNVVAAAGSVLGSCLAKNPNAPGLLVSYSTLASTCLNLFALRLGTLAKHAQALTTFASSHLQ